MNPMTLLAALAVLAAVIAAYTALIFHDRVRSLAWMAVANDQLLQQNADLRAKLDDAERETQRLRATNDWLLRENSIMSVRLRYSLEATAGAMLMKRIEVEGYVMVSREGNAP